MKAWNGVAEEGVVEIRVLIEPVAGNGFRAVGGDPFPVSLHGTTREELLEKLRAFVAQRMANGAEVVRFEVAELDHPLLRAAGVWDKDDPLVQEWKQIMEENRRKANADPDY